MASHVEHEIEEIQRNKQGYGRRKGQKVSDSETDKLIDLLEKHFCLWDVSKKEYHLRNLRERAAYEEKRDELDIEIADIKTKIMNLRSQLGLEVTKKKSKKSGQAATDNYKSTSMYWDRLHFRIPVMQAGKSKDYS